MINYSKILLLLLSLSFVLFYSFSSKKNKQKDVVFQNFESGYGDWKVEGNAFKDSPFPVSRFAPNNQVQNYQGKFIVNSYNTRIEIDNADKHIGTLTSPEFVITRDFITFLIAGGNSPESLHVKLLVEGKKVASIAPYGGLEMEGEFFETKKYKGKKAQIQIVDNNTGAWGFIAVDNIIFSDSMGECEY